MSEERDNAIRAPLIKVLNERLDELAEARAQIKRLEEALRNLLQLAEQLLQLAEDERGSGRTLDRMERDGDLCAEIIKARAELEGK